MIIGRPRDLGIDNEAGGLEIWGLINETASGE